MGNGACSTPGCGNESRWPRRNRGLGFCDPCLTRLVQACDATVVRLGNGPRDRFRTRHNPCGAVVDVSLAMVRRGGWVCQMCKWLQLGPRYRAMHAGRGDWPVALQEQLLAAAGMRSLLPLGDADGLEPVNVECLQCGGAQADKLDGISEGLRLSWLPCAHCNAARFQPTTETIGARFDALGLRLLDEFDGDPGRPLQAECRRCGAPRAVAWAAISSGSPPCLRCDGARLDPDAPHRVYLVSFPHLGDVGVYKVGITHCADDGRLKVHQRAGGVVVETVRVRALGLTGDAVAAALTMMRPGHGWSQRTTGEQTAARVALVDALHGAVGPDTVRRWRAVAMRPLLAKYYAKAKKEAPSSRAVLTKALQPTLAAFFAGDWLALLDYLGEQPAAGEEITTALPEPQLYVQSPAPDQPVAAGTPVHGGEEAGSPVARRVDALREFWAVFDAAHAQQRPGMRPLNGLVGDGVLMPGEREPFRSAASERLLPAPLLAEIEDLWGGALQPRHPDRIVSARSPHEQMADAFGPALRFWHELAVTAWHICEGPYARTDLAGLARHYAEEVAVLAAMGTPVPAGLFAHLKAAERRLGRPQEIVRDRRTRDIAPGFTLEVSIGGGTRRDGYEILRDIIATHRRAWARSTSRPRCAVPGRSRCTRSPGSCRWPSLAAGSRPPSSSSPSWPSRWQTPGSAATWPPSTRPWGTRRRSSRPGSGCCRTTGLPSATGSSTPSAAGTCPTAAPPRTTTPTSAPGRCAAPPTPQSGSCSSRSSSTGRRRPTRPASAITGGPRA